MSRPGPSSSRLPSGPVTTRRSGSSAWTSPAPWPCSGCSAHTSVRLPTTSDGRLPAGWLWSTAGRPSCSPSSRACRWRCCPGGPTRPGRRPGPRPDAHPRPCGMGLRDRRCAGGARHRRRRHPRRLRGPLRPRPAVSAVAASAAAPRSRCARRAGAGLRPAPVAVRRGHRRFRRTVRLPRRDRCLPGADLVDLHSGGPRRGALRPRRRGGTDAAGDRGCRPGRARLRRRLADHAVVGGRTAVAGPSATASRRPAPGVSPR